jgi:hypothetical protein
LEADLFVLCYTRATQDFDLHSYKFIFSGG